MLAIKERLLIERPLAEVREDLAKYELASDSQRLG